MSGAVSPTESETLAVLRALLLDILPAGVPVIQGQTNRVPPPKDSDYVVYWPIRRQRLATNTDESADAVFTGQIVGTTMTIASVLAGQIVEGQAMFGTGVLANTKVVSFIGGAGGTGTYLISPSQAAALQTISGGQTMAMQETQLTLQIDVHGPLSGDNAQIISTVLRDGYAVDWFNASGLPIAPLHADEPRQLPFVNENQQVENRWSIDAAIQINATVALATQYADVVDVDLISVDAVYPP